MGLYNGVNTIRYGLYRSNTGLVERIEAYERRMSNIYCLIVDAEYSARDIMLWKLCYVSAM